MRRSLVASLVVVTAGGLASLAAAGQRSGAGTSPAAGVIAYLGIRGGQATIYRIAADGSGRRPIVAGADKWWGFSWSPDGRQLVFTRAQGGLYVVGVDGTGLRPVIGDTLRTSRFADSGDSSWSPDGSRIAFASRSAGRQIFTVKTDGTDVRQLTTAGRNYYPDWSPDGNWILFERNLGGLSGLMAIKPDGSGLHRIATIMTGKQCLCADWSPDGTRIAFQATASTSSSYADIFVMKADGRERTNLTNRKSRDENPDWSPDGTKIAFYSERYGNGEILVTGVADSQVRRVTHDPWYAAFPRWQPAR